MLNIKKDKNGRAIIAKSTLESDTAGEVEVLDTDGAEYYHNGVTRAKVVTDSHSATLTNKEISADDNIITELEVDNLKAGVLNTDLSVPTPTDTEIPSALAVKTYVDDSSATVQVDVDDLITLSGVPANSTDLGTFTGTTIPDNSDNKEALQALETYAEQTDSDLDDHINETVDAHDASAISNVPSGNLAATDVQAALNELQSDIDTRATITQLDTKITGPASSTDNALVRFDGTTGKLVQNSSATLSDAGDLAGLNSVSATTGSFSVATVINHIAEGMVNDTLTSGANQTLVYVSPIILLTNSGLTSIAGIDSPTDGRNVTIINRTGNAVSIGNDSGSAVASTRILTGTGAAISLANEASILLKYDSVHTRWNVIGGSGSGGGASLDTIFQLTGTDVASWSTGDNATFLGGGTLSGTFVSNTTTPLQGLADYKYTQASGSLNDYLASPAQPVDVRFRGQNTTLYFPYTYNGANNDIEVIFYDVTNATIIPSSVFIQASTTTTIFKTNVVIPLTCASIRVGFMTRVLNSGKIFEFDSVQITADATVYASVPQGSIGEIKWLADSATPTGFIPANNSSIGLSGATFNGSDYFPLYEKLWALAGLSTTAGDPFVISSAKGASAAADWAAAKRISIDFTTNELFVRQGGSGRTLGSYQASDNLSHTHIQDAHTHYGSINNSTVGVMNAGGSGRGSDASVNVTSTIATNQYSGGAEARPKNVALNAYIRYSASSINNYILTGVDTFSTDTAPLVYAGSAAYTFATLNTAPVGTFLTYTFTAGSNAPTQTNLSPPSQSTTSMNSNGIQIFARSFNTNSIAAQPAFVAIQIGKGLKGVSYSGYSSTGKANSVGLDYTADATTAYGLFMKEYNESTGILVINAGLTAGVNTGTHGFIDVNLNGSASAYIVINASKNPSLTGMGIPTIAARGVSSSGQSIPNNTVTAVVLDAAKTYDTHGALNAATGTYTAPETGYYQVNSGLIWTAHVGFVGGEYSVVLNKNGVQVYILADLSPETTTSTARPVRGSDTIYLVKGDTVTFAAYQSSAGARTLATNSQANYFSIQKVNL